MKTKKGNLELTKDEFWKLFIIILDTKVKDKLPEVGTEADMMFSVQQNIKHILEFLPYGY